MNPIKKGLPLITVVAAACSATPEPAPTPKKAAEPCCATAAASSSCCTGDSAPKPGEACCSGATNTAEPCCEAVAKSKAVLTPVVVQLLFLDLSTCTRCQGTDLILEEAAHDVASVAAARGAEVRIEKIHVETPEQARALGFQSSPTIRVNGRDVGGDPRESSCQECGALCGTDVDCRVWSWEGKESSAPPKALVVDAIVRELYGIATAPAAVMPREIPENLRRFFDARSKK